MKRLLWLVPLLASCGAPALMVRSEERTDPPGKDEAKVVVFRDSSRNKSKPYAFFDDQELLGFAQVGAWFEVLLRPGNHFFYLHGVTMNGVRADLAPGKTYYLRVDSVPKLFRLQLRLTPITPEQEEFEHLDQILADLERREPVEAQLKAYSEKHADLLEEELAELQTDQYLECITLSPDAGR
jgi:hypothetical protein